MSLDEERPRRARGDQSVYWSDSRQRFIAEATVGYSAMGKRISVLCVDDHQIVQVAKHRDEVRYQIDRAEGVGGD